MRPLAHMVTWDCHRLAERGELISQNRRNAVSYRGPIHGLSIIFNGGRRECDQYSDGRGLFHESV
jgi:hypothetical protein